MIKRTLLSLLFLIMLGVGLIYLFLNKPLPKGESGPDAEALANKMLSTLNKSAWDSTNVLKWNFKGMHTYVWDKQRNYVQVSWGNNEVLLNLNENEWEKSKAYEGKKEHIADKRGSLLGEAYGYFCNDSFWLIAPFKVNDEGTTRQLIVDKNEGASLLVSYSSGGITPGDSYQWFFDETGLPVYYKMWVSIIPIGGVKATWEDWQITNTKAKLSFRHQLGPLTLEMNDVQTGMALSEIGVPENLFDGIK